MNLDGKNVNGLFGLRSKAWKILGLGTLLASVALFPGCQSQPQLVDDPGVPSVPTSVAFDLELASHAPDSSRWATRKDSGVGGLSCVGTRCQQTLPSQSGLGSDTLHLSLWQLGLHTYDLPVTLASDGSGLAAGRLSSGAIGSSLQAIDAFLAFRATKADSFSRLGPANPSQLVAFFASRRLARDTSLKGLFQTLPPGLSSDSLDRALVLVGVATGRGWTQIAAVSVHLDSISIQVIVSRSLLAGILKPSDTIGLGGTPKPVDTTLPRLETNLTAGIVVSNATSAYTVVASASSAAGIDSIEVGAERHAASACTTSVVLAVGSNPIDVQALDRAGKRRKLSFSVVRRDLVGTPTADPPAGSYGPPQWVKLSDTTSGAGIEWSLDNSTWTAFKDSLLVAVPETLYARSGLAGRDSAKARFVYTIQNVAKPVFQPIPGRYIAALTATFASATPGATYQCSLDGGPWATCSGRYTVSSTGTLHVRAFRPGMVSSEDSASYRIVPMTAQPQISLVGGSYAGIQTATVTCPTPTAVLQVSTDSSVWTAYAGPVTVDRSMQLFARAFAPGMDTSVVSATYIVSSAPPTFSASGSHVGPLTVAIATGMPGALVRYSMDSLHWQAYSQPIPVKASGSIWASDSLPGGSASAVVRADFHILLPTPAISPAGGAFQGGQAVSVTDSVAGASLFYSFDSVTWIAYTAPLPVNASCRMFAKATAPGLDPSAVAVATFKIGSDLPVFGVPGGTYSDTQTVAITAKNFAIVRYSTDSLDWKPYATPLVVAGPRTIWARDSVPGLEPSPVVSATYSFRAAPPKFSLPGGNYPTGIAPVTLSATNSSAVIRYTLDGKDPDSSSLRYATPIQIVGSQTLKAVAFVPGWASSPVASAAYLLPLPAPVSSVLAGAYTSARSVVLTDSAPGAAIFYTTDGMDPTTASTAYAGAIAVAGSQTVKAIAVKAGWLTSPVASWAYTITGTVASPTFDIPAGSYPLAQSVSLSCATPGATIRYTVDGTAPNASSPAYAGPISVATSQTIQAIATKADWTPSAVASSAYTITGIAAPTFAVPAGSYPSTQTVALACATPNATIFYTMDGKTPTSASAKYTAPFQVPASDTVLAVAALPVVSGWAYGPVSTAAYTINGPVADPVFSSATGTYTTPVSVTITSSTPGATILYTLDGTVPTAASAAYSGPILVSATQTINAIATKPNWANSSVSAATYTITGTVAAPIFNLPQGPYSTEQTVVITCPTPGATMYYTINTFAPTTSSTLYTGPIFLGVGHQIRVIAVKPGWANSPVVTASYIISNTIPWNPDATYGTMVDSRDGQTYRTVAIGNQTWMAQNLNYKGSATPVIGSCYLGYTDSCAKYGRYYTWNEAAGGSIGSAASPSGIQGICPVGWHLPSDAEWSALATNTNDPSSAGMTLRSRTGWIPNSGVGGNGSDDFGFRALPSSLNGGAIGIYAWWWSSTIAPSGTPWYREMLSSTQDLYPGSNQSTTTGLSVRCVAN